MKCEEIIRKLEEEYPLSCAEEWDNPGLLVGRRSAEIEKIYVTLDVTDEALEEACRWEADLIVSHHPLIFGGIRQVNEETLTGRRILKLIEQKIASYTMHTNFDVCQMADLNETQLRLRNTRVLMKTRETEQGVMGIGRVGELPETMKLAKFAEYVKKCMKIPDVRCYGKTESSVKMVAVSGGSGKSVVQDALRSGAEVLVTGDIDYHTAIDAVAEGLCIIDAGHYGTEYGFIAYMEEKLRRMFPECKVKGAAFRTPYCVI